jgi:hypothetical protein
MDIIISDINKKRMLLQRLIDSGGACAKAVDGCGECPLATAGKRSDGSWMSCLAAVTDRFGDNSYADEDYAKLALTLLQDLEIESMLSRGDNDHR